MNNNVPIENFTSPRVFQSNSLTQSSDLNRVDQTMRKTQDSDQSTQASHSSSNRRCQGTEFLSQLSEVAAKRLDEGLKVTSSVSVATGPSNDINIKPNTSRPGPPIAKGQKRTSQDLGGDIFGNCLHSNKTRTPTNESESSSTRKKTKRDRSHLRKGKWTPEEEEYTSRIIQHFRSGLLTLPEGTTLRSYIAQKLTCDPMRITKKFSGASCLGKRVYHLHERSQYTIHDVDMAKAELNELERRFRLRVEKGNCHQALFSHPTNQILNNTNQSNFTNARNIFGFPYVHPTLNMSPLDPAWLAKYASALGASALSAPGLSAIVLQLIATQQIQQAQQAITQQQQKQAQAQQPHRQPTTGLKQPQLQQFQVQQPQQSQQTTLKNPQHGQQLKVQQHIQHIQQNSHLKRDETPSNIPMHPQQQKGNVPMASLQALVNPTIISNLLPNQVKVNSDIKQLIPKQQETSSHVDLKSNYQHQGSVELQPVIKQPLLRHSNSTQCQVKANDQKIPTQLALNGELQHSPKQSLENKKKHSKEDVDAGNTLLIFLQELRKNHDKAMLMPVNNDDDDNREHSTNRSVSLNTAMVLSSNSATNRGDASVSTAGLVSETPQNTGHLRNYLNDATSSLSGDARSVSVNKDESVQSESSNESGLSSEDDQKLNIQIALTGPIRKRYRRNEFSHENVERHKRNTSNS